MSRSLELSVHRESWTLKIPFRISGRSIDTFDFIEAIVSDGTYQGRGEGYPIHYLGETLESLEKQIAGCAARIKQGVGRVELMNLLPRGGARNAIDCALWDLEAKSAGQSIWDLTSIVPKPLTTAFTIGIEDSPEAMAQRAEAASAFPILKIKLDANRPVERVAAIRSARPDARLVVDANQGWTFGQLLEVTPAMKELGVRYIEQPLRRGRDEVLEKYRSGLPLCADESCQDRSELEAAARRYQMINIKLDKAGGLTEALILADEAEARGLETLVGNMGGTSLSMAAGFVLAQRCNYVELDGYLLLNHDKLPSLPCEKGVLGIPSRDLWG